MAREQLLQYLEKEEMDRMERRPRDLAVKGSEDGGVTSGFKCGLGQHGLREGSQ